uniref:Uncharacterized protein n=1 Tax=Moniliophthora roreri TaxID=221103 RepID=A0A0W0FNA4_MONRR
MLIICYTLFETSGGPLQQVSVNGSQQ